MKVLRSTSASFTSHTATHFHMMFKCTHMADTSKFLNPVGVSLDYMREFDKKDPMYYDSVRGTCPNGHVRMLED